MDQSGSMEVKGFDNSKDIDTQLAEEVCKSFGVRWAPGGSGGGTLRWASGPQEGTQVTPLDVATRGAPLLQRFGVPNEQWGVVATRAVEIAKETLRKAARADSKDAKAKAKKEREEIVEECCEFFKKYIKFQPSSKGMKVLLYRRIIPEFSELPEGFMWEVHQASLDFKRTVASEIFSSIKEGREEELENKAEEVEEKLRKIEDPDPIFEGVFSEALARMSKFSKKYDLMFPRNVKLFSWNDAAKFRIAPDLIQPGETPNLDKLFSRMSHPLQVMAWIGRLFNEDDCKGRQLLWGVSKGHAGQSTLWNAVASVISPITSALQEAYNNNQFTSAKHTDKRLAMMGDCKNRMMHTTRLVKNLTGGDTVDVENKHEKSYTEAVWCRVLIHANVYPEVDLSDKSQTTRMLVYELDSIEDGADPHMGDKFKREMGHFIWKCLRVEKQICHGTASIPVPPSMYEIFLRSCVTQGERYLRAFIQKNIRYHPESPGFTSGSLWKQYRASAVSAMDLQANKNEVEDKKEDIMRQLSTYLTSHLKVPLKFSDPNKSGVSRYVGAVLLDDSGDIVSPDGLSKEGISGSPELIEYIGTETSREVPTLQEILSWGDEANEEEELDI